MIVLVHCLMGSLFHSCIITMAYRFVITFSDCWGSFSLISIILAPNPVILLPTYATLILSKLMWLSLSCFWELSFPISSLWPSINISATTPLPIPTEPLQCPIAPISRQAHVPRFREKPQVPVNSSLPCHHHMQHVTVFIYLSFMPSFNSQVKCAQSFPWLPSLYR